jgi:hypothetical protein
MHLYRNLDRLQDKARYCDLDSVIYIQLKYEPALVEKGDNLGAMSSEVKPAEHVSEYVGAGLKSMGIKQ